ncbi:hypothetical protein KI387_027538, partial [Taxus chinensis]
CLRYSPNVAVKGMLSDFKQTVEKPQAVKTSMGSTPLAWNKILQNPTTNVSLHSPGKVKFTWEKDKEGIACLKVPDGCLQRALDKVNLSLV